MLEIIIFVALFIVALLHLRDNIHEGRSRAFFKEKLPSLGSGMTKIMKYSISVLFLGLLLTAGQQHEKTLFQRNIFLFIGLSFLLITICFGEIPLRLSYHHHKKKVEKLEKSKSE